ncbi:MAG: c-type cytochrome [Anaerolineae bacterium]|nr:c-type cytochrome [Anaerolineae bacterium]
MLANILGLFVLIALVVLFAWLATRAWRARNAILKWVGVVLAGLLTLLLVLVTVVAARGLVILYQPRGGPTPDLQIAGTPEQIARGQHIASTLCAGCHSTTGDVPLDGSNVNLSDDAGLPLGTIFAPNLTPAGRLKNVSNGQIWRIFRYGVNPDGRQIGMPAINFKNLSDEDLLAVIAYLRSQPAIEHDTPPLSPSLLLAAFVGADMFRLSFAPVTGPVVAPPKAATAEYGQYIVSYNDCRDCHGANLDGRPTGPVPPGPNLRVVKGWTQEQFITTMRTGVDPSGHELMPPMPWKQIGRMDDVELAALYQYLYNLPPLPGK